MCSVKNLQSSVHSAPWCQHINIGVLHKHDCCLSLQSPSTSSTAQGGGAIAAMSGNVTLEGVLLANNSAINGGGAVYFSGLELNTLVLRDSNCSDNVAGLVSRTHEWYSSPSVVFQSWACTSFQAVMKCYHDMHGRPMPVQLVMWSHGSVLCCHLSCCCFHVSSTQETSWLSIPKHRCCHLCVPMVSDQLTMCWHATAM